MASELGDIRERAVSLSCQGRDLPELPDSDGPIMPSFVYSRKHKAYRVDNSSRPLLWLTHSLTWTKTFDDSVCYFPTLDDAIAACAAAPEPNL